MGCVCRSGCWRQRCQCWWGRKAGGGERRYDIHTESNRDSSVALAIPKYITSSHIVRLTETTQPASQPDTRTPSVSLDFPAVVVAHSCCAVVGDSRRYYSGRHLFIYISSSHMSYGQEGNPRQAAGRQTDLWTGTWDVAQLVGRKGKT